MNTYCIYADKLDETRAALDKMAKKAARYGVPFAYSVGEEHPETVNILGMDETSHTTYVADTFTAAAVDISIDCDGLVKKDGWAVCAHIEHGTGGNIVTMLNGEKAPSEWFHAAPRCDHCNSTRKRKYTFMCISEEGELRQVGSTCLKDYTGISPAAALMWAEVKDLMPTVNDCTWGEWGAGHSIMYDVETVIAHAVDEIAAHGYRKSDTQASTKASVIADLGSHKTPTPEGLEKARLIVGWLKTLGDCSDIERNAANLVRSGFVRDRHIGYLAWIPVAYDRAMDNRENAAGSGYVGHVKDRLTVKIATAALLTSWETDFGTTYLYKFTDNAGNVYIWKASKKVTLTDGMTLTGTVKAHGERDGIKQTELTRCKVA